MPKNMIKLVNGTQDFPHNCYQATSEKEAKLIYDWLNDNDIEATVHDIFDIHKELLANERKS